MLLLLQLGLGGSTNLDHGHAPGQLGQPLLELFPVVVGGGVFDLGFDLVNAGLDILRLAVALDYGGLLLGDLDLLRPAEHADVDILQLVAHVFGDESAAGKDGDVFQHGLAAVAEGRGLHGGAVQDAPQLVDHQGGQGLALDVLGDDQQLLAGTNDFLQQREKIIDGADFLLVDQDVGFVQLDFHGFGVGDKVGGGVAAVELHALDHFHQRLDTLGLLHSDHAVLADFIHGLGDQFTDLLVVASDGGDVGDRFLGLYRNAVLLHLLDGLLYGLVDAALQEDRVGPGGDVL